MFLCDNFLNSSTSCHRKQWNPFYSDVSPFWKSAIPTIDTNYLYWDASMSSKVLHLPSRCFPLTDVGAYFLYISQVYRLCYSEYYLYYLKSSSIFHVAKSLNCVFWLDIIIWVYIFSWNNDIVRIVNRKIGHEIIKIATIFEGGS
jgi:hypothetical protein